MKHLLLLLFSVFQLHAALAQQSEIRIVEREKDRRLDVLWKGQLLTSYRWDDSIRKPFLYPLKTVTGITVTRGWPLDPRGGERTDHPHHTGVWMNYESVNGLDFWNNSTAIEPARRHLYGSIRHDSVTHTVITHNKALIAVKASWLHPDGRVLINERTSYVITVNNEMVVIDRKSTLAALSEDVVFKDVKDGFFAIRVARELEMPSTQADAFTDASGHITDTQKKRNNEGTTGRYISSEGKTGDSVWGTKGRWVMLQGKKEGKNITIGMLDHPSNVGYPAYWHARGYGLFAVNPFGRKVFSNGAEELNFNLKANTAATFKYSLVIAEKTLSEKTMDLLAEVFARSR